MPGLLEQNKNRIYFISGLGADRRAFKKLTFPSHFELIYLDWINPVLNESLEDYACRLAARIDTSSPFYLIGLSFGGMISVEIAKRFNPVHTFLISSTPVFNELPWYFRLAGKLSLQKILPLNLLKSNANAGLKFMGAKTSDDKIMLKQLIKDSDPLFLKWALTCILNWRNIERPENITHIHGNDDYTLPMRYNKPDVVINGGGHFMVYSNAYEISNIIMGKIG
ncbi:alpha/beta hydrolase [Pedobacter sp. MC2016-14]|uniref:alpha/beta hydrolase n=1 Tax=Pedobacter sp. MC2016-14 TaxID=2897327 RepID=UPI001E60B8D6|nr:alpha/beta hydrolase [Pedobacter sp. MC2016-14]MCD0490098.1 alpha/beta hydrolase [Pedobacter sp. MC2016-14]